MALSRQEQKKHRQEARGYMKSCTNRQLEFIIQDETERSQREGDVGEVAEIMLDEAQQELNNRLNS